MSATVCFKMKIMILHKIFKNIANQLTDNDILRLQKKCEEFACFKECECTDAYSLLLFLEAQGEIDESNLIYLCALLRQIKRPDLLVHLSIISQVLGKFFDLTNIIYFDKLKYSTGMIQVISRYHYI